jgi:hypothetical protein
MILRYFKFAADGREHRDGSSLDYSALGATAVPPGAYYRRTLIAALSFRMAGC